MQRAMAIVHAGAAMGAAFAEYTAEMENGGELGDTAAQRFIYVTRGAVTVDVAGKQSVLGARGYAYLPCGAAHRVAAKEESHVIVIEKPYLPVAKIASPQVIISNEDTVPAEALD